GRRFGVGVEATHVTSEVVGGRVGQEPYAHEQRGKLDRGQLIDQREADGRQTQLAVGMEEIERYQVEHAHLHAGLQALHAKAHNQVAHGQQQ
nr:hypothetical protein [Tanacetum cinerariifolium]